MPELPCSASDSEQDEEDDELDSSGSFLFFLPIRRLVSFLMISFDFRFEVREWIERSELDEESSFLPPNFVI